MKIEKDNESVTLADKLQTILDHYGSEAQLEILIEECAELIQAVQKLRRYSYSTDSADYYERFKEEVADVAVMIEQMMIAVGEDEIRAIMSEKVERQLRRIETVDKRQKT